ncbi:MAG: tRNA 2-selenouridine(34) synthase MnmH [Desulfovibrionaceae bacterium]|nr:tRNA 2-selenouridine(34) synthase MnmH [Desulfovibrionaceae bacterium]
MPCYHDAHEFLSLSEHSLLVDVRSPQEYAQGHIPHALSLPLFSNAERAAVGTCYAQQGKQAAVSMALSLVGGQLAGKLQQALALAAGAKDIYMYCWRGGMRSGSMAWLLEAGGFQVHLLRGGYKAYRTLVRQELAAGGSVHVLGGMTGSGKTDILLAMRAAGAQVIDLEGLACHRGSVFGGLGMPQQPHSEMMENSLHQAWVHMDFSRPVWVEDESRRIGNITLCNEFFSHIEQGILVTISIPRAARVHRLVSMYAEAESSPKQEAHLLHAIALLEKRLGNALCRQCQQAVQQGNYATAVAGLLDYYDKGYQHALLRKAKPPQAHFACEADMPEASAAKILAHYPV